MCVHVLRQIIDILGWLEVLYQRLPTEYECHCKHAHDCYHEITPHKFVTEYSAASIIQPPWDQELFRQSKSLDNQTNIHEIDKTVIFYSQVISLLEDPLSRHSQN